MSEAKNSLSEKEKASDPMGQWHVGADGIPVKNGDYIGEEDGEYIYCHADGTQTYFV